VTAQGHETVLPYIADLIFQSHLSMSQVLTSPGTATCGGPTPAWIPQNPDGNGVLVRGSVQVTTLERTNGFSSLK